MDAKSYNLSYQFVQLVELVWYKLSNGKTSVGLFNDTLTSVIFESVFPGGVKYNCLTFYLGYHL